MSRSLSSPLKFESAQDYVRAYFVFRKQNDPSFGYRVFARELGFKSASYLQMVVAGRRILSLECAHRLARKAKLSHSEHQFLECLTLLANTTCADDESFYKKRLRQIRKSTPITTQIRRLSTDKSSGIEWQTLPLIALLAGIPEGVPPERLASALNLSSASLEQKIQPLIANGTVALEAGHYKFESDSAYFNDPRDVNGLQRSILAQFLNFSQTAFTKQYQGSKFYSHTFTADPARIAGFGEEIRDFFGRLTSAGESHRTQGLVQLNLQCFDLNETLRNSNVKNAIGDQPSSTQRRILE